MTDENSALLRRRQVVPTSARPSSSSTKPQPTVYFLLETSDDPDDNERGMVFLRRVFGLLVLQYSAVLLIASPFALVTAFQEVVEPLHGILEVVAVSGIVLSLMLALTKGTVYPWARVAFLAITIFVALEMGLSFANPNWGRAGFVAIAQATSSFCIILALLQFDTQSLLWLTYPAAMLLCLSLAGIWTLVQLEAGISLKVACAVSLGGWVFAVMVLMCCFTITKHVTPEEFILATLFILVPEALLCLASKKRHPDSEENDTEEQPASYGGVLV